MQRMISFNKIIKASITVEACLVLPIFIYSIVAILYFLQIIVIQENIQSAITQTGEYASQYAFLYDYIENYETKNQDENKKTESEYKQKYEEYIKLPNIKETLILKVKMREFVNESLIDHSCIVGGMNGINLTNSSFLEQNDTIDIIATYRVKIPISFLGIGDIPIVQAVKLRAFTGYKPIDSKDNTSGNSNENDTIVYITRTGSVYHLSRDCTYIKLNISQTNFSEIDAKRNEDGGKYYACESCARSNHMAASQTVYITSDGNRYHSTLSCSRLKRSVIETWRSKVVSRTLCSRCSKHKY